MPLQLHNTLSRQLETFSSDSAVVSLYTCGPTVYNSLTVGNWAAYIYWDTLVRTLLANDYIPKRVMNITDVGHLVSDGDEGEDKMEKGARREGKTAWEVADFYAKDFLAGMDLLGLIAPEHLVRATDFIPQQLELVRSLKEKGFTYQINDGIYFDTSKFPTYADFAQLDLAAQKAGARVEFNSEKRNPSDFALWKFTPDGEARDMQWPTPSDLTDDGQGLMGFPGWHLECSAMAMSLLGTTIDIHTGGIDHIPVHHTNEIAQSEAATDQLFSRFWLHNNHLKVDGTKISKSLGNGYTLNDLKDRGFSALDYRMFILQSHYQTEGNFTFDNLEAAKNRRVHWRAIASLRHQIHPTLLKNSGEEPSYAAPQAMLEAINNNLNTPEVMRLIDETFTEIENSPLTILDSQALQATLGAIDELLGLQLVSSTPDIDDSLKQRIIERERARENKDWQRSDEIRHELLDRGVAIRDTSDGTIWHYSE